MHKKCNLKAMNIFRFSTTQNFYRNGRLRCTLNEPEKWWNAMQWSVYFIRNSCILIFLLRVVHGEKVVVCDVAHAGVYEGTAGAWSVVRLPGHSSNCRVHALMPLMSAGRRGMSNFLILQDNINIFLQWKYFWVGSSHNSTDGDFCGKSRTRLSYSSSWIK